jgi:hypothetical protein
MVAVPVKLFAAVMVTDDDKLPLLTDEPNDIDVDENVTAVDGDDTNVTVMTPVDDVGNAGIVIGTVI